MLVAVVSVVFTRNADTGRMLPAGTPIKVTNVPLRWNIEMLPATPTYKARHSPAVKDTMSLVVTATALEAGLGELIILFP